MRPNDGGGLRRKDRGAAKFHWDRLKFYRDRGSTGRFPRSRGYNFVIKRSPDGPFDRRDWIQHWRRTPLKFQSLLRALLNERAVPREIKFPDKSEPCIEHPVPRPNGCRWKLARSDLPPSAGLAGNGSPGFPGTAVSSVAPFEPRPQPPEFTIREERADLFIAARSPRERRLLGLRPRRFYAAERAPPAPRY